VWQPCNWVYALGTFLAQAQKADVLPEDSGTVNALSISLRQQLERAGFAQHLASAITEAAQQLADLQDRPEAIAAGLAELSASPIIDQDPMSMSPAAWALVHIYPHLQQLTFLLQVLGFLWPQDELRITTLPALINPVMELLVRLVQHASLCLSHLPDNLAEHPLPFVPLLARLLVQLCGAADSTAGHSAIHIFNDLPFPAQHQKQQQQL
jgi:hypothetical protein